MDKSIGSCDNTFMNNTNTSQFQIKVLGSTGTTKITYLKKDFYVRDLGIDTFVRIKLPNTQETVKVEGKMKQALEWIAANFKNWD